MDRNKQTPAQRGPKSKLAQQPPDLFIALGSKQSNSRDDSKRSTTLSKSSPSHITPGMSFSDLYIYPFIYFTLNLTF